MANTTNYNWETPDDTDLVKDGALAIRTLGSAVDTTVFNNAAAAIAKSIVDAKGDIIAATAADTVSRLAVGANDTVLTADSSTATGLKWAAPSSITYTSYTPTFTGFTLGNGTVDAGYLTLDQLIVYHGVVTFGTTSSFTGTFRVSVPVNIKAEGGNGVFFIPYLNATLSDTSATVDYPMHCGGYSQTVIAFVPPTVSTYVRAVAANYFEGTIPVTIANNDQLSWMYVYRKA